MTFNNLKKNCIFGCNAISVFAVLWLAVLLTVAGCGGGGKSGSSGGDDENIDTPASCNPANENCNNTTPPPSSPPSSPEPTEPPLTLLVTAIGPWANASINLYTVDPRKLSLNGSKLVLGETNEQVEATSVSLTSNDQLFVFEAQAKANTTNVNTDIAPVVTSLKTLVNRDSRKNTKTHRTNYSTLVTTMALHIAGRKLNADSNDSEVIFEVNDALHLIADQFGFGLLNDLNLLNTAPVISSANIEFDSIVRYRTALEAISAILLDLQSLTGKSTDELLMALADDISDGVFDGQRFTIAIKTFDNFDIVKYLNALEVANMEISNTSKSGNPDNAVPYIISEVELLLANEIELLGNSNIDTSELTNGKIAWEPTDLIVGPDCDKDGVPDFLDSDEDNDGIDNKNDAFPCNNTEWLDTDGDTIGDNADPDDDGDGIPDDADGCPLDGNDFNNLDGDELCDYIDPDIDNDGVINGEDFEPRNPEEQYDTDGDGIGNYADPDDDNDGTVDGRDECPLDGRGIKDLDRDGICDGYDDDEDGDGFDSKESGGEDGCDRDPFGHFDMDGDGACDYIDNDIDGDGFDNPDDAYETDPQRWYNCDDIKDKVKPGDDLGNCEGIIIFPSPTPSPSPPPPPTELDDNALLSFLDFELSDIAVDQVRGKVYATDAQSGALHVLDAASGQLEYSLVFSISTENTTENAIRHASRLSLSDNELHVLLDAGTVSAAHVIMDLNLNPLVAPDSAFDLPANTMPSVSSRYVAPDLKFSIDKSGVVYDAYNNIKAHLNSNNIVDLYFDQQWDESRVDFVDNGVIVTIEYDNGYYLRSYNATNFELIPNSETALPWKLKRVYSYENQLIVLSSVASGGTALLSFTHSCRDCRNNSKPTAEFTAGPSADPNDGFYFTFDAKDSLTGEAESVAEILWYAWDWDADGLFELGYSSNNMEVTPAFAYAGSKHVSLKVKDSAGLTDQIIAEQVNIPFTDSAKAFEVKFQMYDWAVDKTNNRLFISGAIKWAIYVVDLNTGFVTNMMFFKNCQPLELAYNGITDKLYASLDDGCRDIDVNGEPDLSSKIGHYITEIEIDTAIDIDMTTITTMQETRRFPVVVRGASYNFIIDDMVVVDSKLVTISKRYVETYHLANGGANRQYDRGITNTSDYKNLTAIDYAVYSNDSRFNIYALGGIGRTMAPLGNRMSGVVYTTGNNLLISESGKIYKSTSDAADPEDMLYMGQLVDDVVKGVYGGSDNRVYVLMTKGSNTYLRQYCLAAAKGPYAQLGQRALDSDDYLFESKGELYTIRHLGNTLSTLIRVHAINAEAGECLAP